MLECEKKTHYLFFKISSFNFRKIAESANSIFLSWNYLLHIVIFSYILQCSQKMKHLFFTQHDKLDKLWCINVLFTRMVNNCKHCRSCFECSSFNVDYFRISIFNFNLRLFFKIKLKVVTQIRSEFFWVTFC